MVTVTLNGKETTVKKGKQLVDIVKDKDVLIAKVNNVVKDLRGTIVKKGSKIDTLKLDTMEGFRAYQRSLTFLLVKAGKDIFGYKENIVVENSISKGFYCKFQKDKEVTQEKLDKLTARMNELINMELPIEKFTIPIEDAIAMFKKYHMCDKASLLRYKKVKNIEVYKMDGFIDYFYGFMVSNTGSLKHFKLVKHNNGFVLQFPDIYNQNKMPKHLEQPKLTGIFEEFKEWNKILGVSTVSDLNDMVIAGKTDELIRISEALQEKKVAEIADMIKNRTEAKIVLIAGPSSSGKTTFSKRLSVQLKVNGYNPHPLSLDNYFVNRVDTPRDENGDYDFECLKALDVKLFNEHLAQLLNGEEVEIPTYNFRTGEREYNGKKIKLGKQDVLVIEGIHGLNEKLTEAIDTKHKFKIYISALTPLNLDKHNRVSTTDTRMFRRLVRDAKYRGHSAEKTLGMWQSVRKGEEKYIFPFQEEADVMFNSALIYETAVLKQFAEPLLTNIDKNSKYYIDAQRQLEFLDHFLVINTESIPATSLIREFIGGSCFRD